MNCWIQAVCICFCCLFSLAARAQCFDSRPLATSTGQTVVFTCPGTKNNIISIPQFSYSQPFVFVLTNKKDTVKKLFTQGIVDMAGFPEGEYRIYGYSYKGPLNEILGRHLPSHRIANFCSIGSSNFITVIRSQPIAPILGPESNTPIAVCAPDGKKDLIQLNAQFPSNTQQAYLVADEAGKILTITAAKEIDADALNCKTCKIHAIAYTGQIIAKTGDPMSTAITDDCFSVSPNHLTIHRALPMIGSISWQGSGQEKFVCADSKKESLLEVTVTGVSGGTLHYLVTDSADRIVSVLSNPVINPNSLGLGICRIRGLVVTGTLRPGLIGESIINQVFTNDCYKLSPNFISIKKERPKAGTLSPLSDENKIYCSGDTSRPLPLVATPYTGEAVKWLVVDSSQKIIWEGDILPRPGSLPIGIYTIHQAAFTGNFLLKPGSLFSMPVSDDCFALSDNSIKIQVDRPLVGRITSSVGGSEAILCSTALDNQKIKINHVGHSSFPIRYFITDRTDIIISQQDSTQFDFSRFSEGTYRIYGVSYLGLITFEAGRGLFSSLRSSYCHQISTEYVSVSKVQVQAGIIRYDGPTDSLYQCILSARQVVKPSFSKAPTGKHRFLVFNQNDRLVAMSADSILTSSFAEGVFKIRSLAYSDSFSIGLGATVDSLVSVNGCIDLGSKELRLIRGRAEGGTIQLSTKETTYTICSKDGWPDRLSFTTNSSSLLPYRYVATDRNGLIIQADVQMADLELLPNNVERVYGLSYDGSLHLQVGDSLFKIAAENPCVQISSQFVSIKTEEIQAGTIRTSTGQQVLAYCLEENLPDTIRLQKNGASAEVKYSYLGIRNDTIQFINFSGLLTNKEVPTGTTRVYGMAYKGNLLADAGSRLSTARLTDSCYGISSNFITLQKSAAEAGSIASSNGQSVIFLCPRDGQSDFINLSAQQAGLLSYAYLITDTKDSILAQSAEPTIDLDSFPAGECRIYGISYKGALSAKSKHISATDLASGCSDISSNYIRFIKSSADGGRISLAGGDSTIAFCVEDAASDTLRFQTTSTVGLNYVLLVTNTQNRVQYIFENIAQGYDFNGLDPGNYRVYGLSYGGGLTVFRNTDVLQARLASGCFDLSKNFVQLQLTNTGPACKNFKPDEKNSSFLAAFPNPANLDVQIRIKPSHIKEGKPALYLVSATGGGERKINLDSQSIDNETIKINTAHLPPGMYFLIFKNGYIFDSIKILVAH
jgi:hypothetical protein